MQFIRSLLFVLIFYTGTVGFVVSGTMMAGISRRLMQDIIAGWARFHHACARAILHIDVVIEGEVPTGPVIYAVKHESMFETVDLPRVLNRPAVLAKEELFDIPMFGWLMRQYGNIPVARDDGARAMRTVIAAAQSAVAAGRSIVIFPEGTRTPSGARPEIKAGVMGIYRVLDLPLVPIALDSGRVSPRRSFIKRAGVIRYRIGETIPPGLSREAAAARVHTAINVLNEERDGE